LAGESASGQKEDCILDVSRVWQFTAIPLGLCNVAATFEMLIENIFRGLTYQSYPVYLDDVNVIGRMFQEHLLNMRKVFQLFREARLNVNSEKCQFFSEGNTVPGACYRVEHEVIQYLI
jgi:hypothetical protein